MKIFVDIDETLCTGGVPSDYSVAQPITDAIAKVNAWHEAGHHITLWTARGAVTGIDWRSLTESQLKRWGVRYDVLRLDKPYYDVFVDDRAFESFERVPSHI